MIVQRFQISFRVFAGLDPAIHGACGTMDPRVKPAGTHFIMN
jgi:hypothetical protein